SMPGRRRSTRACRATDRPWPGRNADPGLHASVIGRVRAIALTWAGNQTRPTGSSPQGKGVVAPRRQVMRNWLVAVPATLVLAACGGGADNGGRGADRGALAAE